MKAFEYIGFLSNARESLRTVYVENNHPCEPVMISVWRDGLNGKELVPIFAHEKDKNKSTIKSLRYTYRDL